MQLLVSVANAADAVEAIAGGADWVDAKDPSAGPLGRVSADELRRIRAAIDTVRPLSAALGDIDDETTAERISAEFSQVGIELVKIGAGRLTDIGRVARITAAAVRGARLASEGRTGVVAVAYADSGPWGRQPAAFVGATAQAGASGVLLDTADKNGPGLCAQLSPVELGSWVAAARHACVQVAMAGRLTVEDLRLLAACAPDVAGVRGAACRGGRSGAVAAERVMALRAACTRPDRPGPQSASRAPATPPRSADRRPDRSHRQA